MGPRSRDEQADQAWEFVEALCQIDAGDWLRAAARQVARDDHVILMRLVRQERLGLTAWLLNDGIDSAVWWRLRGRRDAPASARAAAAARSAMLAVLLRPRLGEQRFRELYAPFASLIPAARAAVFTESLCAKGKGPANVQLVITRRWP